MRHWLGTTILTLLGISLSLWAAAAHWPIWLTICVLALTVLGIVLSWPVKVANESSAFVRGDASGSSFTDVRSDAHTFIDGNARETLFTRVQHRRRRPGR